jgi:hypothetical protein
VNPLTPKLIAGALLAAFPAATFADRLAATHAGINGFADAFGREATDDDTTILIAFITENPEIHGLDAPIANVG